ncbi:molecular chaperone DnaJ [Rhodovulum sp. DZ06]|uniref:molecular chaperone DnaJ n=1 Tax=Rhodovulum sp. DZ06 TaxID=3425126 RepID=UPI003D35169B
MAPPRSIFDFDVSVSADKARRQRKRGMSGAFESSSRPCEHPGCEAAGAYRAPRSPQQLDEYRWFCLDHVREFNKSWNFYEDWSEDEIERQMRSDSVWDRPTWSWKDVPKSPIGQHPHAEGRAWARFGFNDPLDALGENATINPGAAAAEADRAKDLAARALRRLPPNERKALSVLGEDGIRPKPEIRKSFRELVKSLHPDMNGGSREDEQRLTQVLWAWDQIKGSRNFPD